MRKVGFVSSVKRHYGISAQGPARQKGVGVGCNRAAENRGAGHSEGSEPKNPKFAASYFKSYLNTIV